jgi:hypothetical protein
VNARRARPASSTAVQRALLQRSEGSPGPDNVAETATCRVMMRQAVMR